jgi:hypothetical protein
MSEAKHTPRPMQITLLDTQTGETKTVHEKDHMGCFDSTWWQEGNGSCDCNRAIAFGHDCPHETCLGAKRYLIIDTEEGNSLDVLLGYNADYPYDLLAKHLPKEAKCSS